MIPALEELKAVDHWVAYRFEEVDGRRTKVPYVGDNGHKADSTKPSTWRPFSVAASAYQKAGHEGVGFVVSGDDPYTGIDLDHCRDAETGAIEGWAQAIVDQFDSYTEITPSREGLRIWIRGSVPADHHRKGHIEIYDRGRYFTVTGKHLEGTPTEIHGRQAQLDAIYAELWPEPSASRASTMPSTLNDAEVLDRARRAKNGATVAALLAGDTAGYDSGSEADLALISLLAFYTQDRGQLDRLYRGSGLYREKWERADYRDRTVNKALATITETYGGSAGRILSGTPHERNENNEKSSWPEPPGSAAYMGLAGEIRDFSDPHTEADPVAVLTHFLLAFGSAVGSAPHVVIGATCHPPRNFAAIVGKSSKARKGDSAQIAGAIIGGADPVWAGRIRGGLSSGEGVIAQVRDEVTKADGTVVDEGVGDKRMFIIEPEFARVLTVMKRQGNTVSAVLRDAWDSGRLATMTKSPMVATGAHISTIAHITVEELRRELDDTSLANGFANRFLWIAARRSKELPMPEPLAGAALARLSGEIGKRINLARLRGAMILDPAARDLWHDMYTDLSRERDGLVGGILTRSEAHVIRLALIYALLDGAKETISPAHILAGAELLAYSERSVEFVFGDSTGDPIADAIIRGLSAGPMTRTEIMNLFSRNEPGARIDRALRHLHESGRARMRTEATAGRPREVWAKA